MDLVECLEPDFDEFGFTYLPTERYIENWYYKKGWGHGIFLNENATMYVYKFMRPPRYQVLYLFAHRAKIIKVLKQHTPLELEQMITDSAMPYILLKNLFETSNIILI